ncbi:3-dehydroquinate synthase [Thiomicrospira microaerophila]|uniref:3-dehydroquinate synthase n=1 Tax=Thiomicrospira microaerophila TaxID=406020 RepID=UPI002010AB05|nr:3-dehydroquinate synthase [Thiomicrospira microaerophila]UQB42077.1 3-dehydroquinate synthase [Thiomicrospira microaerophila]
MITLKVDLAERSYPIYIGQNLLNQAELVRPYVKGSQVMIVTNSTVAPLYLEACKALFEGFKLDWVILPDGEQYKSLEVLNQVFDKLIGEHFDRKSTLVALGGGVIGDMTGFAAAAYQRGVPFIQIPTTLLSQVDSSVGGKTGVNHPKGKNMIGAFHQPQAVLIDTNSLNTLEDRQLSAGLAEVIKYGLIRDLAFFEWLEEHLEGLLARDPELLAQAIERSCQNKADIVAADETEQGQRALLNLGHTFGHAVEAGMGYGVWLHGEAISAGMMQAAYMSQLLGDLTEQDVARIAALFRRAKLPIYPPNALTNQGFMHYMAGDKKVQAGVVRLVLLKSIGQAYISGDYPAETLTKTLTDWRD